MDAEAHLSSVENGSYGPGEAMGALAEAVDAVNREMGGEPDGKRIRQLVAAIIPYITPIRADFFGPDVDLENCYINRPVFQFDYTQACAK